MFGMIPFVKAAGRGLGAMIRGRKGKGKGGVKKGARKNTRKKK